MGSKYKIFKKLFNFLILFLLVIFSASMLLYSARLSTAVTVFLILIILLMILNVVEFRIQKRKYKIIYFAVRLLVIISILIALPVYIVDPVVNINIIIVYYLLIMSQCLNWIVAMTVLGQIINRFIFSSIERIVNIKIPSILRGLIYTFLLMSGICGILVYVFNQNITALLTASGLLSLVIGLAIKENLSNVFSGIFLAIDRNFKKGDILRIEGIKATVINISWRCTILKTGTGDKLIFPNSKVAQSVVINHSVDDDPEFDTSMITYPIHIHPDHDPEYVKKIIQSALDKSQAPSGFPLMKKRDVFIHGLTEKGIEFLIRFSCFKNQTIIYKDIVLNNIHKNLKIAGIRTTAGALFSKVDPDIGFKALQNSSLNGSDYLKSADDVVHHNLYHEKLKNEVFLNKVAILNRLPKPLIVNLANEIERVVYPKGSRIINQGDTGSSMFIIVEGAVIVEIESNDNLIEVGRLGNADFFGEMSLLTGERRTANITSVEQTVILEIRKDQMKKIFDESPDVLRIISEVVAARQAANRAILKNQDGDEEDSTNLGDVIMDKMKAFFGMK